MKGGSWGFVSSRELCRQSLASGWWSEHRRRYPGGRGIRGCGSRAWTKERERRGVRGEAGELIKEESKGLGNLLKDGFAYCSFHAQCLPIIAPSVLYWVSGFLQMGRKEELKMSLKVLALVLEGTVVWTEVWNSRAGAGTGGKMMCSDWVCWVVIGTPVFFRFCPSCDLYLGHFCQLPPITSEHLFFFFFCCLFS